MPRDGSGVYAKPFPDVVSGTTIQSTVHNGTINDLALDNNTARPIVAGGTGATTAASARTNLGILNIAGDTMTGNLTIAKTSPAIILNKAASTQDALITGQTAGVNRWNLALGNSTAEAGSAAGSDFEIYRYNDAGAVQAATFSIKRATGNVGIGTSAPGLLAGVLPNAKILTIVGASDRGLLELSNALGDVDNAALGHISFLSGGTSQAAIISQAKGATAGNRGSDLTFYTKANGGAITLRMTIDNAGNVGANSRLIAGGSAGGSTDKLEVFSGGVAMTSLGFYQTGVAQWSIGMPSNSPNFNIYTGGSMTGTRKVLINTQNFIIDPDSTATNYNFIVGGQTAATGVAVAVQFTQTGGWNGMLIQNKTTGGGGNFMLYYRDDNVLQGWIQGNTTGVIYGSASDRDVKEDIQPLRESFDSKTIIRALQPRRWKAKGYDVLQQGFVAQEVYEVLPDGNIALPPQELVGPLGEDGKPTGMVTTPWGINYDGFVPYMIDAMQLMQDEIDTLKTQLEAR